MRSFLSILTIFVMSLLALVSACGSGDTSNTPDDTNAPRPVGSASIDARGGVVEGDGVRLTIPEGAVADGVIISIAKESAASATPPNGYVGISPIYVFTPDGLVFQRPVTVEIPLPVVAVVGSADTIVWSSENDTRVEELPSTVRTNVMIASVVHFSRGFIGHRADGVGPPRPVDQDAGSSDASSDASDEDGSIADDDAPSCHPSGGSCDAASQCCSSSCNLGTCGDASVCKSSGAVCASDTECCNGKCVTTSTTTGTRKCAVVL